MENDSTPAENPSPARATIFSPFARKSKNIPGNRNGISARAENRGCTCAVILFSRKQYGSWLIFQSGLKFVM